MMHTLHCLGLVSVVFTTLFIRGTYTFDFTNTQNSEGMCVLNFVVPKESISSNCGNDKTYAILAKMDVLEARIVNSEKRVHYFEFGQLPLILAETESLKTSYSTTDTLVKELTVEKQILEDKVKTLANKVNELLEKLNEITSHESGDRYLDPIKPLLLAEFESVKDQYMKQFITELQDKHNQSQHSMKLTSDSNKDVNDAIEMIHANEETFTTSNKEMTSKPTLETTTESGLSLQAHQQETMIKITTLQTTTVDETPLITMTTEKPPSTQSELKSMEYFSDEDYTDDFNFNDFLDSIASEIKGRENTFTDVAAAEYPTAEDTSTTDSSVNETTLAQRMRNNTDNPMNNNEFGHMTNSNSNDTNLSNIMPKTSMMDPDDNNNSTSTTEQTKEDQNGQNSTKSDRRDDFSMTTSENSPTSNRGKSNLSTRQSSNNIDNSIVHGNDQHPNSLNKDNAITADTDSLTLVLHKLNQLEATVTELQKNHTHLTATEGSLFTRLQSLESRFMAMEINLQTLQRVLDGPANNVLPANQVRFQINGIKQEIQDNVQSAFLSQISVLENKVILQERGINLTNNMIGSMKRTLQSQDERIRSLQSNIESQVSRLEKIATKPAGMDLEVSRRLEDIENRFVDIEMQQNFALTKIDNVKDVNAKIERDTGMKFREMHQQVNMFTNQLGEIPKLNLSVQVLDAKYMTLVSRVNTVETTANTLYIKQKLQSGEWMNYNFSSSSVNNKCHGHQYVKRNPVNSGTEGRFVGVSLCNDTRYKIFLGNALDGEFLDIGDYIGHCEDHCEFVGGVSERQAKVDPAYPFFEPTQGFARGTWGEEATMSLLSHILKPTVGWYECGVTIP